ncbi:thiolase family protein [Lysinibacillus xylanilyticus]|uniref:thiolase family protein n=1 Tax=Lysinibacillus xylanilyticus TaxID=582475 RepID=UPI003D092ECD
MNEVVIVEAIRSPIAKRNGGLKDIRPDDLLADVLKGLVERANLDAALIEDVVVGCVSQVSEQAGNIARTASLIAGFPINVPGTTLDRQCGSSQQALHFASQAIQTGDMDIVIAAGVESMSRVPMFSSLQGAKFSPKLFEKYEIINQGESAERIAEKWKLTRDELDLFAFTSHQKAIKAIKEGKFNDEILPIQVTGGETFHVDEVPREDTTLEVLAKLKSSFRENGLIHPGNSSAISDGASAVLLMSMKKAEELNIKPRFKVVAKTVVGSDPTLMLTGVIPATEKVLEKAGLTIDDIDHFEVNEAFAPVVSAWQKETGAPIEKINPNGGAIALGHPLGASGTRLFTTMMYEMERTNAKFGLVTMCEGQGMANATIIEKLD